MTNDEIIESIEAFVKKKITDYDGGHDWWHIERVRKLAKYINSHEGLVDPYLVDVVALLHESADSKFTTNIETEFTILGNYLNSIRLEQERDHILEIISNVSFSVKKNNNGNMADPVLFVVQDADRLDAIGAIGIARAFTYGGYKRNALFNPENAKETPSTIKHFYDKLLLLKEKMNTRTAKMIAEERHHFMELFLTEFYSEWEFAAK